MASNAEDVNYIVASINSLWPKFQVTKQNFLHPTPEFIVEFYHEFLTKIDELIASMCSYETKHFLGDILELCPPEINKELFFYVHLNRWLLASKVSYFKLTDLCQPVKRSKTTIKFAVNFILYFTTNLFKFNDLTLSLYEKKNAIVELRQKRTTLKEDIARLSYDVGVEYEKHDVLVTQHNAALKREAELIDIKIKDDAELKQLDSEVKSLLELLRQNEEQWTNLTKENESLYEQLVSEEEYDCYLKTIEGLDEKSQELDKIDADYLENLEIKLNDAEYFEELLAAIKKIDLTDLDIVQTIESAKKELVKIDEAGYATEIEVKKRAVEQAAQAGDVLNETYKAQALGIKTVLDKMGNDIKDLKEELKGATSYNVELIKKGEVLDFDVERLSQVCNSLEQDIHSLSRFHEDSFEELLLADRDATAKHKKNMHLKSKLE